MAFTRAAENLAGAKALTTARQQIRAATILIISDFDSKAIQWLLQTRQLQMVLLSSQMNWMDGLRSSGFRVVFRIRVLFSANYVYVRENCFHFPRTKDPCSAKLDSGFGCVRLFFSILKRRTSSI